MWNHARRFSLTRGLRAQGRLAGSRNVDAMALWLVRAGSHGEYEQFNLERSIVSIAWTEIPDVGPITDRAALTAVMSERYPDKKPSGIANWAGQVWTFAKTMHPGDLVAMPLKSAAAIQFAKVVGPYEYGTAADLMPGAEHHRKVEWIKSIPRTSIDADLLYSFGAIMTVFRVERNDAEKRIRVLLDLAGAMPAEQVASSTLEPSDQTSEAVDLEEALRDAIRTHIARKFNGHGLAELVEAVLQARGYKTHLSPPGPDGGVDVLAGLGPHGFDGNRLAVQVKSGSIEVDTTMLRLFKTAMQEFQADRGLFVSWGGYKPSVRREIARQYFNIRMWGEDELIDEILDTYDLLPAAMKARLPLKRTWILIMTED